MVADNYKKAKEIAAWKQEVVAKWDSIEIKSVNLPEAILYSPHVGEEYPIEVAIDPKGLGNCIGVELVVTPVEDGQMKPYQVYELNVIKTTADSTVFHIDYQLSAAGTYKYSFRMYPKNPDLPHRQDFAYVRWF